ncbi:hypothetical protein PCE1_000956 [Barthelona sp. PCE]
MDPNVMVIGQSDELSNSQFQASNKIQPYPIETLLAQIRNEKVHTKQPVQPVQAIQPIQGYQITDSKSASPQYLQFQNVPNMQGSVQGMQRMQGIQGVQNMQNVQGMQNMQIVQGVQNMQNLQGMQPMQGFPNLPVYHTLPTNTATMNNFLTTFRAYQPLFLVSSPNPMQVQPPVMPPEKPSEAKLDLSFKKDPVTRKNYSSLVTEASNVHDGGVAQVAIPADQAEVELVSSKSKRKKVTYYDSMALDDGWHWRKYGQKFNKSNPFPTCYYKCAFPKCPAKKQVFKDSKTNKIVFVYRHQHNHRRPRVKQMVVSTTEQLRMEVEKNTYRDEVIYGEKHVVNSVLSDIVQGIATNFSESKKRGRSVYPQQRFVVEIEPEKVNIVDHCNDGFSWKKYGQKTVKGSSVAKAYFRCAVPTCPAKKLVQMPASEDSTNRSILVTYEHCHNHCKSITRAMPVAEGLPTKAQAVRRKKGRRRRSAKPRASRRASSTAPKLEMSLDIPTKEEESLVLHDLQPSSSVAPSMSPSLSMSMSFDPEDLMRPSESVYFEPDQYPLPSFSFSFDNIFTEPF